MRVLYDVGFAHRMPFWKKEEEEFNNRLKEATDYLLGMLLSNLKPPTEKIDKIFLEGLPEDKDYYSVEELSRDEGKSWITQIKKLCEKYSSRIVGMEKKSYYYVAYFSSFLETYSENKLLKNLSGKFEEIFNGARTYYFAKTIDKELKEGEIGVTIHGKGHEIMNYLNRYAPDIKVYPVKNALVSRILEDLVAPKIRFGFV
jgi:hypothetical protein